MNRVSVVEAGRQFDELLERVVREVVTIELERDHQVVAILSPAEHRMPAADLNRFFADLPSLSADASFCGSCRSNPQATSAAVGPIGLIIDTNIFARKSLDAPTINLTREVYPVRPGLGIGRPPPDSSCVLFLVLIPNPGLNPWPMHVAPLPPRNESAAGFLGDRPRRGRRTTNEI